MGVASDGRSPVKTAMLAILRGYKRFFSPTLPASCRFVPSCADYAAEAIARHGAFYGFILAAWRVMRCNPFSRGGLDLVPSGPASHEPVVHKLIHNHSQAEGCSHVEHAGRPCS